MSQVKKGHGEKRHGKKVTGKKVTQLEKMGKRSQDEIALCREVASLHGLFVSVCDGNKNRLTFA